MSAWWCQLRDVRHTSHLLKCVRLLSTSQTDWRQSSDILSDISFGILSDIHSDIVSDSLSGISRDILSGVLSDILLTFFLAYLLSFFLTYLLAFFWHILWYSFWHYFWHIRWHFVWHSFWHIFWHFFSHSISGLRSENNGQRRSQLRSRRHWAQMVTIEVRHGTLGSDITPPLIPPRRQKCKLHFPMAAAQVSEITENPLYKCNLDHEVPTSYQQTSKCNVTFLPSYSTPVAQSDHQVRK